jgi:hypothetical protein
VEVCLLTIIVAGSNLDTNFVCYCPTTPAFENLLANYSKTNKDYFLGQLDSFIQSAEKAVDEKTMEKDACKAWQQHFGEDPVSLQPIVSRNNNYIPKYRFSILGASDQSLYAYFVTHTHSLVALNLNEDKVAALIAKIALFYPLLYYCIALQDLLTPHQLSVEVHWYRSPNFPNTALAREVFVARTGCARKLAIFRVLRSDRVRSSSIRTALLPKATLPCDSPAEHTAFVISDRERDSRYRYRLTPEGILHSF